MIMEKNNLTGSLAIVGVSLMLAMNGNINTTVYNGSVSDHVSHDFKYSNSSDILFYGYKDKEYVGIRDGIIKEFESSLGGMVKLSKSEVGSYNRSKNKLYKSIGVNIREL